MHAPTRSDQLVLAVCAATGLSAVAGALAAAFNQPAMAPFTLGFELTVLLACGAGVLLARGRFREGPGLALLIIAGCVGVSSLLGYLGAGRVLMGVSLTWALLARLTAAGLLALLAAAQVLGRGPRSGWWRVGLGVSLGVPVLVMGALLRGGQVTAWLGSLGPMTQAFAGFFIFCGLIALTSASVHLVVRAFEAGELPAEAEVSAGAPGAAAAAGQASGVGAGPGPGVAAPVAGATPPGAS